MPSPGVAFYVSYAFLWVLVPVLAVLVLLLYRHFGVQAMGRGAGITRDGLKPGEAAKLIAGVDESGRDHIWTPGQGRDAFVLFASAHCEPCREVLPDIVQLAKLADTSQLDIVLVSPGPADEAAALRVAAPIDDSALVIAEDGSGAFQNWKVRGTPFAFVVDADGTVRGKDLCNSRERLVGLLNHSGQRELAQALSATGDSGHAQPLVTLRSR